MFIYCSWCFTLSRLWYLCLVTTRNYSVHQNEGVYPTVLYCVLHSCVVAVLWQPMFCMLLSYLVVTHFIHSVRHDAGIMVVCGLFY